MNTLSYRGYLARVDFDDEDKLLVGRIVGIEDGVTFHAGNVDDLTSAFHDAVDDYVETCAKVGKVPAPSYSGRLTLHVDPELHRRVAFAAERAGLDLAHFAATALQTAVEERERHQRRPAATRGGVRES